MSEKYFTSYKSHRKINRKKFESEARTAKEADNYSTYKFKTAKNATVKKQKENITEPKTYSRPKILSSTQNINQKQEKSLLVIQKEIKNCLKSNG